MGVCCEFLFYRYFFIVFSLYIYITNDNLSSGAYCKLIPLIKVMLQTQQYEEYAGVTAQGSLTLHPTAAVKLWSRHYCTHLTSSRWFVTKETATAEEGNISSANAVWSKYELNHVNHLCILYNWLFLGGVRSAHLVGIPGLPLRGMPCIFQLSCSAFRRDFLSAFEYSISSENFLTACILRNRPGPVS